MAFVVVVRREEPDLFQYLQHHFQEPEVSVLMDRRFQDRRRQDDGAVPSERRRQDRRACPLGEDSLWKYGFRVAQTQAEPQPA
jgi:hypothetical protein